MTFSRPRLRLSPLPATLLLGGAVMLSACEDGRFDLDLRSVGDGFDTSAAARSVPARPAPDARGVISYPNTQVVLARQGETVSAVAARLGLEPAELARFNGVAPDTMLRRDELLALPRRITEQGPAAPGTLPAADGVDVTELASAAIDRAGPGAAPGAGPAIAAPRPEAPVAEPIRHRVARGETVYTVSRLYGVPVPAIAEWNGLGPDLAIREGQQLLVPNTGGTVAPDPVGAPTVPGQGSPTPLPPSAAAPLPQDDPAPAARAETEEAPPAPDLGAEAAPPADDARLAYPVDGPIIRAYARGRNEGIDISAPAGTPVKAAAEGTVAAITQDTDGASIVVLRHDDNLLTVYVNLTDLQVSKDDRVGRGQTLARIPEGDPSYLHFETRQGLQSVDPADLLP